MKKAENISNIGEAAALLTSLKEELEARRSLRLNGIDGRATREKRRRCESRSFTRSLGWGSAGMFLFPLRPSPPLIIDCSCLVLLLLLLILVIVYHQRRAWLSCGLALQRGSVHHFGWQGSGVTIYGISRSWSPAWHSENGDPILGRSKPPDVSRFLLRKTR